MDKLAIDHEFVTRRIVEFMKREVRNNGFEKVILGLSGGTDSSLVAYLAVKAFGRKNALRITPKMTIIPILSFRLKLR